MNFCKNDKHHIPDINLTPLVDVVLLLVLFFMVTSQFSILPGLTLKLPRIDSDSEAQATPGERLEIAITEAGDIYFEEQPTIMKNIPYHLQKTGAAGDDVVIVINADRSVPYGQIIKIMDTLREEGFNRVVFAASHEKREEETDLKSEGNYAGLP